MQLTFFAHNGSESLLIFNEIQNHSLHFIAIYFHMKFILFTRFNVVEKGDKEINVKMR